MMRKRILAATAVAAVALGGARSMAADDDAVHWLGSYSQALAEARRTGKPIFLEYRCEP
jgi:hypothetical protein